MGLDAFVNCDCYKEGKTKPFPLPELEQYFGNERDGIINLHLDCEADSETRKQIYEWEVDACEHDYMWYANEHISNWGGYRYFQQALEDIGWIFFPTLFAELPNANGGIVKADDAAKMLEELTLFRELANRREMPFLVETKSNTIVYNYVAAYEGVFMWAGTENLCLGIDPDGFFVARIHDRDEVLSQPRVDKTQIFFRAMRLEQRLSDINDKGIPQKVEYYDADTENRYVCSTPMRLTNMDEDGNLSSSYPQLLHVEMRRVDALEYDYQLNALEIVCKASVATGNPIVWC